MYQNKMVRHILINVGMICETSLIKLRNILNFPSHFRLGLDPLQRLWENIWGEFPHFGAQVLRMQILQHKADARRACFMLIKDCWDGEMTDLLEGDQRYLYLKINVQ